MTREGSSRDLSAHSRELKQAAPRRTGLPAHLSRGSADDVERPRLLALLGSGVPITVVHGPIGSGKTVLLRQWVEHARRHGDRVVWERGDIAHDVDEFWHRLLDATRSDEAGPTVLVLDALEAWAPSDVSVRLVELLTLNPGLRLVVATRRHQLVDELAGSGFGLSSVGPRQLALSPVEATALAERVGLELSATTAAALVRDAGGWPAVVGFVVDAMNHGHVDLDAARDATADQVWNGLVCDALDAPARDFVARVGRAEVLTVEAARMLSGDDATTTRLSALVRGGLAVHRSSDSTVEILPMLRRLAIHRNGDEPGELPDIVAFYATHDRPDLALQQAAADKDWTRVGEIAEAHWRDLSLHHEVLVTRVLMAMPAEVARTFAKVWVVRQVFFGSVVSRDEFPMSLPAELSAIDALADGEDAMRSLEIAVLTVLVWRRSGHFAQAAELSRRARRLERQLAAREGGAHIYTPSVHAQFAMSHQMAGDIATAIDLWRFTYRTAGFDPAQDYATIAAGNLAVLLASRGEVAAARIWSERLESSAVPTESTWSEAAFGSSPMLADALLALDALDRDATAAALASVSQPRAFDELWGFVAFVQTRFDLLWSDVDLALRRLRRTRAEHEGWDNDEALVSDILLAAEGDLLMARGQGNRAHALLSESPSTHPIVILSRTRMAFLAGDVAAASVHALELMARTDTAERTRLEATIWQAVCVRPDSTTAATALWQRALATSEGLGSLLSTFAMVPRRELREASALVPEVGEVADRLDAAGVGDPFASSLVVIDLTYREKVVLEKLLEGLSVASIARDLFVSPNTIKTQVRTLYRKLGVHKRREALVVARDLGLLD